MVVSNSERAAEAHREEVLIHAEAGGFILKPAFGAESIGIRTEDGAVKVGDPAVYANNTLLVSCDQHR